MTTDVIGSRYELVEEVACTADATTWRAHDRWLCQPVFVVIPDPGRASKFEAMVSILRGESSSHLVELYDLGNGHPAFAVLAVPPAVLADETFPREEEDMLLAGLVLSAALGALHAQGLSHGSIHPGAVAVGRGGEVLLSPWPLAPEPTGWSGPGGFGVDPDVRPPGALDGDLHALGALLLSTLAGPPILSGAQAAALGPELGDRAPSALQIAGRAMSAATDGGYQAVGDLGAACAVALEGPTLMEHAESAQQGCHQATEPPRSKGRLVAIALAIGCALVLGATAMPGISGPAQEAPPKHAPAPVCARPTTTGARCDATVARPTATTTVPGG